MEEPGFEATLLAGERERPGRRAVTAVSRRTFSANLEHYGITVTLVTHAHTWPYLGGVSRDVKRKTCPKEKVAVWLVLVLSVQRISWSV